MAINFNKVEFILSAASEKQFVRDGMPQLAFAGRSNVGKSSVINRLVNRKNFARVGASPGKTSQINYFKIDGKLYLVDLPGYGYAKVPQKEKERWGRLMEAYFAAPGTLTFGVMLVDARHAPTANDVVMANYFLQSGKPFVVVANKLDKLKKSEIAPNLARIREVLQLPDAIRLIPFSAEKGDGRDDLRLVLAGGIDAHIVSQLVELLLVHLAEEVGVQMAGDGVSVRESLEIAAFQQRGIFLGVVHKDVRMRRRGAHNAIIGQTFNQSEVHSVLPPVR